MATIMKYKAPNGETRWRVRWRDNDKQKSKTFDRQKLAKDFMVKIENDMREGSYVSPSKIRVSEYLMQWIDEHQANLAPSTAQRYKELIIRANAKIGGKHLQRLNPGEIQSMYTALGMELSGTTLLQMHRILSRSFKDAVRKQLVEKNPCNYVDAPRKAKFQAKIVPPDEVQEYLTLFKDHYIYPAVCLALFCGLRRSEILALRWSDIDLKEGMVHVNHSIYWDKEGYHLQPPKSKQKRTVPITQGMIAILRTQRRLQKERLAMLWHKYDRSEFVVTYDNGNLLRPHSLSERYKEIISKTKYAGIRFHDLRHTAASLMLLEGEDLKTVSELLGHSSIKITADIYTHIVKDQKRKAVSRLDKYMLK